MSKTFKLLMTLAGVTDLQTPTENILNTDHKNRCDLCEYKRYPSGGHCYMFKDEPKECLALKVDKRLNQSQ